MLWTTCPKRRKNMNKKITLLTALAFSAAIVTASVFAISSAKDNMSQLAATGEPHVLTLSDANSPTISGTEVTKDFTDFIQLRYAGSNMSTRSGRHIIMGNGGTIANTKQIRGISNIKVTAPVNTKVSSSDALTLYVGYSLDDISAQKYAYIIHGTSEVSIDTKCNYFSLTSTATFGISTIKITFECLGDGSKPEVPTAPDSQAMIYGVDDKELTINDGAGTFKGGQTMVTNADGLPYNYKYAEFSVEFKFPAALLSSTTDLNVGLQGQKYTNADGGPNTAFQFGITNFSTGAWAVKVSGTARDSGTLGVPFDADTWYEFKIVITTGSTYNLKCYIDDTLLSDTQRGTLSRNLFMYGMRFDSADFGLISFRNMSLTGHN